jgi:hypothetical protein
MRLNRKGEINERRLRVGDLPDARYLRAGLLSGRQLAVHWKNTRLVGNSGLTGTRLSKCCTIHVWPFPFKGAINQITDDNRTRHSSFRRAMVAELTE